MAIVRKEAYFNSTNGVNKIRTLIWEDDKISPIGVIQIAHGVSEHIGRYDEFARFLVDNGFVVCGNDHLGHGKSSDTLDQLGEVRGDDGHIRMVDDMHRLYNIMHKRYPALPYVLFGHSMGSFLARVYCAKFGFELSGAVFCGTGQIPVAAGILQFPLDKVIEKLGDDRSLTKLFSVTGHISSLPFEDGDDELAWLSRDKGNRDNYRDDPYCGHPLTLGGVRALAMAAILACSPDWAESMPLNLPVMLISGAKDPIGSNGKGVLAVADSLERAGIEPTVILYPGDRHEILNEQDRTAVYKDVLKWLYNVINGDK